MAKLPPGPRFRVPTTYEIATRPVAHLLEWFEEYGDPMLLRALNGDVFTTADPELIKQIFANRDPDLFRPFAVEATEPIFGDRSVLAMFGDEHKRERKLLMPPFHGERMRAYGTVMTEAARQAFAAIGPGEEFLGLDVGTAISLEAIIRAVFGVTGDELLAQHRRAVAGTLDAVKPAFIFTKKLQVAPFGLGPWAAYEKISREFDDLLYAQIEAVRGQTEGREDILSLMLEARYEDGEAMTDKHIRDELRTLLFAGHETTALTLAWALFSIHHYDGVLERLREEVDGAGDDPDPEELARLPYLGAVVDETLRRFPIVEIVFRVLRKPWTFGGYDLPEGMSVAAAIPAVHLSPKIYPEPYEFRPERFLDGKPKPYEYLPFGGGNRRCIGAAFSLFESRVALATALREFEFELLDTEVPAIERRSVTLGPAGGVRLRMVGRRRA